MIDRLRTDPRVQAIAPAFALLLAYGLTVAWPRHAAIQTLRADCEQRFIAVQTLQSRLGAGAPASVTQVRRSVPQEASTKPDNDALAWRDPKSTEDAVADRTPAAVVSGLLAILESNGLRCESSRALTNASGVSRDDLQQELNLQGSFQDMLSALHQVKRHYPEILPIGLSMQRQDMNAPCQWSLAIRLRENQE
ncbi:MAG: hypothetical protein AAGA03_05945 [Planctomycetota bacterium]